MKIAFFVYAGRKESLISSILTPGLFVFLHYQQSDVALIYSQKILLEFSNLVLILPPLYL